MMPTGFQEYCKNAPWNRAVSLEWNSFHRLACDNSRCASSLRDVAYWPIASFRCRATSGALSQWSGHQPRGRSQNWIY